MEDFELGAYDLELYYSEDYEGWLALRKNQLKLHPNDYSTKYRLAEALVLTKNHEEALVFLKTLHDEEPKEEEFNQLILDSLRELGKNKEDFAWKEMPESLSLNMETELKILENMKSKRKRKMKFNDVYMSLISDLLEFDENSLFNYLKVSENILVHGEEFYDAIVERNK